MQVSLLDAKSVAQEISALIDKHDRISIAVAWGGISPVADILLGNRSKFVSILIGVDFSATDPAFIEKLVDVPNAFVAKNRPGCFHPKIFYFESNTGAEAIIGSSNFTKGGFGVNLEANVHVKGDAAEPFFAQVRKQLASYSALRLPIDKGLAESYRRQAKANSASRPRNPILPGESKDWARADSPLATMSWNDFVHDARADLHHDFKKRMVMLRAIQQMFSKAASLSDLASFEWKAIAGVLGQAEADAEGLGRIDWGWFGSMGGAGDFAKLIRLRNPALAHALDSIPKRGDVTEDQFDAYVGAFTEAFSSSTRTARVAPATRLLAMKRPDFFVCVNGGNSTGLAEALSFASTTLSLENYWRRVIEPIQLAPWFNTPRPKGNNMELWDARVAMLDAIYYAP